MRKFQLDQSILETVVRFDVADTAPKRRIGPTAQSPAYGTPHFFFALRRVSLGLVCFFRSHLSSHEPHITASSEQHTSAAGLVVHTSQKVFMFARLEGVCRLSLVDCRRQNVTPFRDEGTKRCKKGCTGFSRPVAQKCPMPAWRYFLFFHWLGVINAQSDSAFRVSDG